MGTTRRRLPWQSELGRISLKFPLLIRETTMVFRIELFSMMDHLYYKKCLYYNLPYTVLRFLWFNVVQYTVGCSKDIFCNTNDPSSKTVRFEIPSWFHELIKEILTKSAPILTARVTSSLLLLLSLVVPVATTTTAAAITATIIVSRCLALLLLATAHHIATTVLTSASALAHIASAVRTHTERHASGSTHWTTSHGTSSHWTTSHLTTPHWATSHHSSGLEATTLEHSTLSTSWTTSHLTASHILATSTTHKWHASMLVSTASFRLIFMLFAKSFFLGILVVLR